MLPRLQENSKLGIQDNEASIGFRSERIKAVFMGGIDKRKTIDQHNLLIITSEDRSVRTITWIFTSLRLMKCIIRFTRSKIRNRSIKRLFMSVLLGNMKERT